LVAAVTGDWLVLVAGLGKGVREKGGSIRCTSSLCPYSL
jgi:hypothetical protein